MFRRVALPVAVLVGVVVGFGAIRDEPGATPLASSTSRSVSSTVPAASGPDDVIDRA
jgi:hypothetical protein